MARSFEARLGTAVRITFLLLVVAPAIFGARSAAAQSDPSAPGDSGDSVEVQPDVVAPRAIRTDIAPPAEVNEVVEIVLELQIDPSGQVTTARALQGPEPFRSAAEAAALRFTFAPALRRGKAVASKIHFLVRFEPTVDGEPAPEREQPDSTRGSKPTAPRSKRARTGELEVIVTGLRNVQVSTRISRVEAREIPGTFGDPLRAVESNPGVTPIYTGVPFFFIRGAPPGNVGFYVDGIRIPLLYHALLGPSVIHPGLIDHVDVYRGSAPARFGGNAGATVAAESREPLQRAGGEGNLRVFDAGGLVETPLDDGRLHVMAGGRYSYTALIASLLSGATLEYWDYQTRVGYDLNRSNRVTVTAFGAFDKFESGSADNLYGGGLQFHRVDLREDYVGAHTKARVAATFGYDRTETVGGYLGNPSLNSRSLIEHRLSQTFAINIGHDANAGDYSLRAPSTVPGFDVLRTLFPTRRDLSAGLHVEANWTPFSMLTLVPGARADVFRSGNDTAQSADARFSAVLSAGPHVRAIETIGTSHQPPGFVPQIPGAQVGTLAGGLQQALQISSGLAVDIASELTATVTAFESRYNHLTDPISQTRAFDLTTIDPNLLLHSRSTGSSVGLEVEIHRPLTHRLGGFIAYTLSRNRRVDNGYASLSGFDRPHVFQGALGYDLGRNWRAGARLMAYSGLPARQQFSEGSGVYIYDGRMRAPAFYRVDARLEKRWPFSAKGYWAVVFEMLNATLSQEVIAYTCNAALSNCQSKTTGPVSIPSVGLEIFAY